MDSVYVGHHVIPVLGQVIHTEGLVLLSLCGVTAEEGGRRSSEM